MQTEWISERTVPHTTAHSSAAASSTSQPLTQSAFVTKLCCWAVVPLVQSRHTPHMLAVYPLTVREQPDCPFLAQLNPHCAFPSPAILILQACMHESIWLLPTVGSKQSVPAHCFSQALSLPTLHPFLQSSFRRKLSLASCVALCQSVHTPHMLAVNPCAVREQPDWPFLSHLVSHVSGASPAILIWQACMHESI